MVYDRGTRSMSTAARPAPSAALHAFLVVSGFTLLFTWLFAEPIVHHRYLTESDLYEYYLPIFLAPITKWSSFEFSGLPAFADPGDFVWYPPHFFFARIAGSWTGLVVSAFVMAASFTYAYVYRLTQSKTGAAFAGLAYGMSEALVERVPHLGTLHCFVWLPLIALAIENIGDRRRTWIAIGGIGVACAFLAGHPQPAIYTVYFTLLYALVKFAVTGRDRRFAMGIFWMYFVAGLLASIKAIPLVEASVLMARQEVNFGQFAGHGNSPAQMLSTLFPTILHEGREAPTYVGLATLVLAFTGATLFRRDWRVAFWTAVAVVALMIGAGSATPVAQLLYTVVPLYQKFRVGARHLFLAAFGASLLAGYAIAALQRRDVAPSRVRAAVLALLLLVAGGAVVQAAAPGAFAYEVRRDLPVHLPVWNGGVWVQLGIAALTAAAALGVARSRRTTAAVAVMMAILIADDLYSLPYPVSMTGLVPITIPAAAIEPDVHAREIGQALAPLHQRALAIGGTQQDEVIPAAFARLWRIPIAGGYGPMLLQRYSDLTTMGTNGAVRPAALAAHDSALDLLAVRYILVQPADVAEPETFERDGVSWATRELAMPVGRPDCGHDYPRSAFIPMPPDVTVAAIAVVTHLRCSEDIPQDTEVMRLRVTDAGGTTYQESFRAGHETAEAGLRDPSVAPRARHHVPASAFDDPGAGRSVRVVTKVSLPHSVRGGRIDLEAPGTNGWITIDRLTLIDDAGVSYPQTAPGVWLNDTARWRDVRRFSTSRVSDRGADDNPGGETPYRLVENLRARPRAWIADEAIPVSDADALEAIRRSQLPRGVAFDPRITALVDPEEGGGAGPFQPGPSQATVEAVEDGRIRIRVATTGGGFLVVSEQDYPGWRARIDNGSPTPVRRTNVALMGIAVPPGDHVVEFELVSNTQRAGAAMSLAGILACGFLVVSDRRRRGRGAAAVHVS